MDQELNNIKINLSPETIDEGYLAALGGQIEILLQSMFGGPAPIASVSGTKSTIQAFARALGSEKKYLETLMRYGLTDPQTLGSRHKLENAVSKFEMSTGIKWPFK